MIPHLSFLQLFVLFLIRSLEVGGVVLQRPTRGQANTLFC